MRIASRLRSICVAIFAALPMSAQAQTFPDRPIHLVMPYSPGGIVDFAGRMLAQKMGEVLGQTVVPDNRPGAGGISGTTFVSGSAPDGYTSVPYDLFRQLQPISIVSSSPEVLVVTPGLPIHSFSDLIAYAKAHPGALNFASAGIGTTPHLAGELLKQMAGIDATHVPYRSIGESYPDLVSNKVQFAFSSIAGALPFTSSHQVTALATTGTRRSAVFPDAPTVAEGGLPGFEVDLWLTIFAPAGLPAAVADKLNGAVIAALKDPQLQAAFTKTGIEARGTSREDSTRIIAAEYAKWKSVIETAGIKQ